MVVVIVLKAIGNSTINPVIDHFVVNHSCTTDAKALAMRSDPCWFGCSPDDVINRRRGEQREGDNNKVSGVKYCDWTEK